MQRPNVPGIDVREADRRVRAEPSTILLDVRESDEFAMLRAPGAVLVPLSEFAARFEELPRDHSLLVVCAVGGRSAMATEFLLRQGYSQAVNVEGGMTAWRAAGLATHSGVPAPGEGELPQARS